MVSSIGIAIAALLFDLGAADNCFYPNGTKDDFYVACDPTAQFSACCAPTDECTTNGLCRPANGGGEGNDFWRNLCTDQSWRSDACPRYCYNATTSEFASSGSFFVTACTWDTYCCADLELWDQGETYACCHDPVALFNAGPAKWLSGPHVVTALYPSPTSTSTTASPTSRSKTTSTSPTAAATTTSSSSSSGLSSGDKVAVGVSVGIGALMIILAAVAYIFFKRSRKAKAAQQQSKPVENSSGWAEPPAGGNEKPVYAHYAHVPADPQGQEQWENSSTAYNPNGMHYDTPSTGYSGQQTAYGAQQTAYGAPQAPYDAQNTAYGAYAPQLPTNHELDSQNLQEMSGSMGKPHGAASRPEME